MNKRPQAFAFVRRCRLAVLVLAMLYLSGPIGAQGFEKTFGGPKEDFGSSILVTKDHGFLNVGSTEGELGDDNDFDVYLVRTDVDGTVIWTRQFDEGFIEQGIHAVETSEQSYFITGFRKTAPDAPDQTYLMKVSRRGDLLFTRTYGDGVLPERGKQLLRLGNGEFLLTGQVQNGVTGQDDILVMRIDIDGNVIWRATYGGDQDDRGIGAIEDPATRNLIIGAKVKTGFGPDTDIALIGLTPSGELRWRKDYGKPNESETIEDIISTSDGNLAFVGATDNTNKALIAKADLNGDTLWFREIDNSPFDDELLSLIEEDNGENLVAVGQTVPSGPDLDILMVKVRASDGQPIYERRLGNEDTFDGAADLAPTPDGGYAISAATGIAFNDMSLFKTNNFGDLQTNYLQGKVYHPTGGDCRPFSEGDRELAGWLVRAEGSQTTFFGTTDSLGNYDLRVDQDVYEVSLLRRNDRWNICTPDVLTIDLTAPYDSSFHDFAVTPAIDCPLLEVSLSATPAIQCEEQTLTVTYGNQGAATATGASIELELAEELTFTGASVPVDIVDGSNYTFELGDLEPGREGSFTLTARVGCASVREGQAVSSMAEIFPIYACSPVDPDWDQSSIVVTSRCDPQDGPVFTITNQGDLPMQDIGSYVIVVDIVLRETGEFQLDAGQSIFISPNEDTDGRTVRLIAEQSDGHPGSLFPTAVEEGCTTGGSLNFTTGQVAQFPDNDGDLNLDILTQEIVVLDNSAEAQLTAYPRGYQDSIIIPKTDIEYTVFFALPVNDTFERVVIRDTLSELLDFNSLEVGAASHPYDFVLYQGGILKITFDSIRIFPGGSAGEAGADTRQGYVSFRLSQKPNNLTGSVIRNRAAVYLDYESPVFTDEVKHVVGCEDYLTDGCLTVSNRDFDPAPGVDLYTYPNPTNDRTTVHVRGWEQAGTKFDFRLYDSAGHQVRRTTFVGDRFEFHRQNLAAGAYFYEVTGGGFLIGSGNIILQ